MSQARSVAIVGAGPAGLVTARILELNGLRCCIFERDSSAATRAQGGVLDMHVEGGQYAFRACNLYPEFLKIARYDEQETVLYDKHGTLRLYQPTHTGADRPETDRPDIRRVLLASVSPEAIQWEHTVECVEQATVGSPVTLHFRGAPSQSFDLVIGADGGWSKVRPVVSPSHPQYSGATFYELHYAEEAAHDAELLALTRCGNMFALGDRMAINSHRTASGGVHVYVGWWTGEASAPAATRDEIVRRFAGWAPSLQRFVALAEDRVSMRVISQLPVGHRWPHRAGVTLIGDAAHLMSPFSGEGANLAMRDATDLALTIVRCKEDARFDVAIAAYEADMFERAERAAVGAEEGVLTAFSVNAIDAVVDAFQHHEG